ncbi:hypothetical protein PDO_5318, partial [Rhizobium sp. PDO1-076]|uniref:hypothetical protein n=1 Tax=Rhizobium sp. PDO1-076 TaxID=1125979 RepID=UPI00024E345F
VGSMQRSSESSVSSETDAVRPKLEQTTPPNNVPVEDASQNDDPEKDVNSSVLAQLDAANAKKPEPIAPNNSWCLAKIKKGFNLVSDSIQSIFRSGWIALGWAAGKGRSLVNWASQPFQSGVKIDFIRLTEVNGEKVDAFAQSDGTTPFAHGKLTETQALLSNDDAIAGEEIDGGADDYSDYGNASFSGDDWTCTMVSDLDPGAKVAGTVNQPVEASADGDSVRRDRYSGIQEGNSDWDEPDAALSKLKADGGFSPQRQD